MTGPDRDRDAGGRPPVAPWDAVWNTVVPALGLALILGASMLPAIAIAGAATIAIHVVLGRGRSRSPLVRADLS